MGILDMLRGVQNKLQGIVHSYLHGEQENGGVAGYYSNAEDAQDYGATMEPETPPEQEAQPQPNQFYGQQPMQQGYEYQYNQQPQASYPPQQAAMQMPPQSAQPDNPYAQQAYYDPQYGQQNFQGAAQPQMQPPTQQPQGQQQHERTRRTGIFNRSTREDNVLQFPTPAQQQGYTHIERIAQLVNREGCYVIIDFMKNGETVIVNIENIASDAEVQHCVDLLSGAAYTLNCSITKFTTQKRAYLISPANVQVLIDPYTQRLNGTRTESASRMRRGEGRQLEAWQRESYGAPESEYVDQSYAYQQSQAYEPMPSYQAQPFQGETYDDMAYAGNYN